MIPVLSLLVAQAVPSRIALVVAVDDYGFVSSNQKPEKRLCAASNDAAAFVALLRDTGFQTRTLRNPGATKAEIEAQLKSLAARAGKDTDVVFYFSGCGSNVRGEPTLVGFDGLGDKTTKDVPMSSVETMAKTASAKGAHVTVVVDACFSDALVPRIESRVFKPIPKCVPKRSGGQARGDLFRAPGVFLCPAQNNGAAYEWWATASAGGWKGVFTDYLVEVATTGLYQGKLPEVRATMGEAAAYFRARVGESYLPGMNVALPANATDGGYDAAFLTSKPLPPLASDRLDLARRVREDREARGHTLRVAFQTDPKITEAARIAALEAKQRDFQKLLQKDGEVQVLNADYEKDIDRVVLLSDKDGLTATVQGGVAAHQEGDAFHGTDPAEAVAAGLGTSLRRDLLVKRLWQVADRGPGPLAWTPRMSSTRPALGEKIRVGFDHDAPGYLYVLQRNEKTGEIRLTFPNYVDSDGYLVAGSSEVSLGSIKPPKEDERNEGPTDWRVAALFLPAAKGDLPPLPPYTSGVEQKKIARDFNESLLGNLDRLLGIVGGKDVAYGVRWLSYQTE